jgi:hypothetical protein
MKRRLVFHIFLFLTIAVVFAQAPSQSATYTQLINRRTAERHLQLVREYTAAKTWEAAVTSAETGLTYDPGISDLWYFRALARQKLGAIPAEILPYLQTAFELESWLDYSRDGARLLYADILSDTGESPLALELLDTPLILYSSEAEYIRVKSYYRIGTEAGRGHAREKIAAAHKIYPEDERFLLLLFQNELSSEFDTTPEIRAFAQDFVAELFAAQSDNPELLILSAAYAEAEQRTRILRAFNARGLTHPLYALFALESGLIDEHAALDYFATLAAETVSREFLEVFASRLTTEDSIAGFRSFLADYAGTLTSDTTGDGIADLTVKYEFGRPSRIMYDKNQDGILDWTVECVFGDPQEALVTASQFHITYGKFPFAAKIETGQPAILYEYPPNSLQWTPVEIVLSNDLLLTSGAYEFFIPQPVTDSVMPSASKIFVSATHVTAQIPETEDGEHKKILFTILDGQTLFSEYYINEALVARLEFENGMPKRRFIDRTGDGRFNTIEEYQFDPVGASRFQTPEEEKALYWSLFGTVTVTKGLYLSKISFDEKSDTFAEFTEEYTGDGGKINRWDTDADGDWDIAYIRYPSWDLRPFTDSPDDIIEDSTFKYGPDRAQITVRARNGVPVQLMRGDKTSPVEKAEEFEFYWIGERHDPTSASRIREALSQMPENSTSIVEGTTARIFLVKYRSYQFGEIIDAN